MPSLRLKHKLESKKADFVRMSLKQLKAQFNGICPICNNELQYSTSASLQLNELVLRCAGECHHDFRKEINYNEFYGVIKGGKVA